MIECQKELFNLPNSSIYLNGAYMSPQLKSVEKIGIEVLRQKSNPAAITAGDFFSNRTILKERFARLVDIPNHQNIAIIPSVSYGIANAANNIKLTEGDNIVVVDEQFPSNIYAWKSVVKKSQAQLRSVRPASPENGRADAWNNSIISSIDRRTKVVALPIVHWADGTLFDIERIRHRTLEVGAKLIIDGTQSIGALPFSVQEIKPDALITTGYKWMMGPYAIGCAYYSDELCEGIPIEYNWVNRYDSENFKDLTKYNENFQPGAERFSVGGSTSFTYVSMLIEGINQLLKWSPSNIQSYVESLGVEGVETLRSKGHFIEEDDRRAHHLFGIYPPKDYDINKLRQRLQDQKILVSYRGNAIRVSPGVYNTKDEFDQFIQCFNQ